MNVKVKHQNNRWNGCFKTRFCCENE